MVYDPKSSSLSRNLMIINFVICYQGRLSDDDGADTQEELDASSEKGSSIGRIKAKNRLPDEESSTTPPNDRRFVHLCQLKDC